MLKVGDLAPDFSVQDHRGRAVRLRDFRGQPVVLWFFPQADTPG
jgi:peroxiredoxin Q/BCP